MKTNIVQHFFNLELSTKATRLDYRVFQGRLWKQNKDKYL